jgi:dTDP-4-amino-4,6-dideoxygalactose transaminase
MLRGMRVPLLDLSQQYRALAEPIRAAIDEVLASQRFILGPKVKAFEQAMATFCHVPHAIGVSSGTDALLAILMALGIGPEDAVITTSYTFFATAACVARVGATPLFVDIDASTYNLSAIALEEFLERECQRKDETTVHRKSGKTIRAIIPVHLFGLCCDMNRILSIASSYHLTLIEDAAQAIGATYPATSGPDMAGTMGQIGFFSFYPSKNLGAAGDAGLIVCKDQDLAEKLRVLREHGMQPRYYHELIGGNFRLDEIQAAILNVKLPHLRDWSSARRTAADFYREQFVRAGLNRTIGLPAEPYRNQRSDSDHIYHQFVIRTEKRDALRKHLTEREIGTEIYYPVPLHLQKCFGYLGHVEGDLPETERATKETLALPIYPEISREGQAFVVKTVADFFS